MGQATVRCICAIGQSGQLGLQGKLPWEGRSEPIFADDVARFFALTRGHVLLAGPSTVSSIPPEAYADRTIEVIRSETPPLEAISKYPLFAELSADYSRTPAQIALRWILQKGVAINTMSTNPDNIRANFDVMNFTLSSVDMARVDALGATGLRIVGKSAAPWAPEWD